MSDQVTSLISALQDHAEWFADLKSLRVLVLVDAFPVSSQTFILDHVLGLARHGVHVTLIARKVDTAAVARLQLPNDRMQVYETPRWSMRAFRNLAGIMLANPRCILSLLLVRCAWHAARLMDTPGASVALGNWDAVHAHFANNGIVALLARPHWKPCLLVNFHGHDATALPHRHGWWPLRSMLGPCHAIVHSEFMARRVSSHTPMKVHRVTMGVDTRKFCSPARGREWPRPLRLLFAGRLVRLKGADVALSALALFRERHPEYDARLRLVGDGPEKSMLQGLIMKLGLEAVVEGPAPIPHTEMAAAMADADILLMPTQIGKDEAQEAFGRVAIEAMACGIPVVGCPSGGLADTIGPGGVVAAGFDAANVCEALHAALSQATPAAWQQVTTAHAAAQSLVRMESDYLDLLLMIEKENRQP